MQDPLDELRQKQRKLIYHFGEQLYNLYNSEHLEFSFPAGNSHHEKEVAKLLKLLDYMDERVRKFEEIFARGEEKSPEAETLVPDESHSGAETVQGPAGIDPIPEPEQSLEGTDASTETVEELVPCSINSSDHSEIASFPPVACNDTSLQGGEADEVLRVAQDPEATQGTISNSNSGSLNNVLAEIETDSVEDPIPEESEIAVQFEEPEYQEAPQQVAITEQAQDQGVVEQETGPVTLEMLRSGVQFKSEAEQRLFKENLDVLQSGDEKLRERSLKAISYFAKKEVLIQVCGFAMNDPSPSIRLSALKIAGRLRDPKSQDVYRKGLQDADAGVRIAAIKGASAFLFKDSVPWIEPMLQDPDPHVRGIAVTCLGIYGGQEGIQVVSQSWNDPNAYVRKSLVDMLAIVRAPGTLLIIKQLVGDDDPGVRHSVENALLKVRSAEEKEKRDGRRKKV